MSDNLVWTILSFTCSMCSKHFILISITFPALKNPNKMNAKLRLSPLFYVLGTVLLYSTLEDV